MKRIMAIMALALCTIGAYAQSMKITGGDPDIFHQAMTFNVVINDSNPVIKGRNKPAKDYYTAHSELAYEEFVAHLERGHESFRTYYNEKKGTLESVIRKSPECPYTLKVNVDTIYVGTGLRGAEIYGNMALIDNSSGNAVCEFEFSRITGRLGPFAGRAISVYRYLADALIKSVQ